LADLHAIEATGHDTISHVIAYSQRRPSHTSKSRPNLQETFFKVVTDVLTWRVIGEGVRERFFNVFYDQLIVS